MRKVIVFLCTKVLLYQLENPRKGGTYSEEKTLPRMLKAVVKIKMGWLVLVFHCTLHPSLGSFTNQLIKINIQQEVKIRSRIMKFSPNKMRGRIDDGCVGNLG